MRRRGIDPERAEYVEAIKVRRGLPARPRWPKRRRAAETGVGGSLFQPPCPFVGKGTITRPKPPCARERGSVSRGPTEHLLADLRGRRWRNQ